MDQHGSAIRWLRGWTLRARLLILVALATVPALASILYFGLEQRRAATARVRRDAVALALAASADEQRQVTKTRQFLFLLSLLPEIDADSATCSAFLANVLARGDVYENIGVADAAGLLRCSAVPARGPVDLSSRSWFRRAADTRDFAVGEFQIGVITHTASVNFGYPVLTEDGRVSGVVFVALRASWLQGLVAEADLPAGSEVLVIGPSMRLLARFPATPEWAGRSLAGLPLGKRLQPGEPDITFEATGLDGVRRLYATARLQETPGENAVTVTVGIPVSVAHAPASRVLARNLTLLTIIVVLIALATWWSSGVLVVRPVRELLRATHRVAEGDLTARAPHVESRNEVDRLAGSFNEMASALEARAREAGEHLDRIQRLNRVYALLSGINSLLLRVREREALLREVCRLAVDEGGFAAAWIGELDPATGTLRISSCRASAREPGMEPETARAKVGELTGLAETALRSGREAVSNDLLSDPRMGPWHEEIRSLGFRSAAAFPLLSGERPIGVLQLFADAPGFFDEEEIHLLRDLAADTSLGLEYIEKEKRLHYLANYDPLTDLPNLALFTDRVDQAIARGAAESRLTGVLVVGIDRFEALGAALGRRAADLALQIAARHLVSAVGGRGTVAHFGSGQFGVELPDLAGMSEVETAAERLLAGTPLSERYEDEELRLVLRVGVAVAPHDGSSAEAILQAATLALDTAGSAAEMPIAFYSAELDTQARQRRRLEQALREGIERDELKVHYQPVVDVRDRKVVGVEALLRWHSPELGDVPPGSFIPVAEASGLIVELGERTLAAAASQRRSWGEQGFSIRVNVNVSVHQLRQPGFEERALEILRSGSEGESPMGLGIEITESALMENVLDTARAVARFKELGLMVYIDDFGTGYSSLSYLRTLAVDAVKIDRSFILDCPRDVDAVAVVRGIVALAKSLGLKVIAEGVETEGQLAMLREMGCDWAQGFLFGRAMPPADIEALLRKGGEEGGRPGSDVT